MNMHYIEKYTSLLGNITLASDGENLIGLWMEGQKYFASGLGDYITGRTLPVFEDAKKWLDIYFSGKNPEFMPKLKPEGTPFQQAVWDILKEIPYGELTTYGAIAKQIAARTEKKSMSAQAIGGAVGHNPISIIIPCHRVVGSDGALTGYAGGLDKKKKLLELEGAL